MEYKADITFSILQKWPATVPLLKQKRLLEDLFEEAQQAKYSSAVIIAAGGGGTVAHQQELDLGWFPLDTEDIQARVVSLMRNRFKAESWSLLQQITLPNRRSTCEDDLTDTFSSYYTVMASSVQDYVGADLPNQQSKTNYLIDQVARLSSPMQVPDFIDSFVTLKLSLPELSAVIDQLVVRLPHVEGSDREMYGAEGTQPKLTSALSRLISEEKQRGINPTPTLLAYRAFLTRNLHGIACADKSLNRPSEAMAFNAIDPLLIGDSPKPVEKLSAEQLKPTSVGSSAHIEMIGGAPELQQELHRIFLAFAANQQAIHQSDLPEDYVQPQPEDVYKVLSYRVDDSAQTDLSPLARYETKQSSLTLLTTLLPPGPSFEDATDSELAYLNLNPIEQDSPESWLRAFKSLLFISRIGPTRMRTPREEVAKHGGMILQPSPNAQFIRDTMSRYQSDPVISTYIAFENTFHPECITFTESRQRAPL